MPLYEYQCDSCGAQFELIRKFSDPPLQGCPTCGAEGLRKLLSSPAFQFKGSGFYATDYAKKAGEPSAAAKTDAESKADAKSDVKGDSRSEAKPEAAKDTSAPAPAKTSAEKPAATTPPPATSSKDK
jgi:putative FmdB family regulatory protein